MVEIDTAQNVVVNSLPTPSGPLGVAVGTDGHVLVASGNSGVLSILDPSSTTASSVVVGAVPVALGTFSATTNDCPGCESSTPPGLDALSALLNALDETIRNAPPGSIRDQSTADAITAIVADARAALAAGGPRAPALRTKLRSLVGTVQRDLRMGALQRDTGFRLLDLARRARVLLVPGRHGGPAPKSGPSGSGPGIAGTPR